LIGMANYKNTLITGATGFVATSDVIIEQQVIGKAELDYIVQKFHKFFNV